MSLSELFHYPKVLLDKCEIILTNKRKPGILVDDFRFRTDVQRKVVTSGVQEIILDGKLDHYQCKDHMMRALFREAYYRTFWLL